jgi:hypothetical protein
VISDDVAEEPLPVLRLVVEPPGFWWSFVQSRRLKQDPLLGLPEEYHAREQQPKNGERDNHVSTLRGFQWVCMAGNLRQCEFR